MRSYKAQALLIAILIYVALLVSIFIMILTEPVDLPKAKNYTDKQSDVIEVSLGSPTKSVSHHQNKKQNKKSKTQNKKESKPKPKNKPKKIRNVKPKESSKKVAKKKTTKPTKQHKPTKPNTHKLFGAVKDIKADSPEQSHKPKGNQGKSPSKESKMRGEKNAYFAKVQKTLMGWPAQNNFAGEIIVVELKVYPTGLFDYKILSKSLNPEFNTALKNYLEQLKQFGFGPHSNPKPYNIVVKFKAKN